MTGRLLYAKHIECQRVRCARAGKYLQAELVGTSLPEKLIFLASPSRRRLALRFSQTGEIGLNCKANKRSVAGIGDLGMLPISEKRHATAFQGADTSSPPGSVS